MEKPLDIEEELKEAEIQPFSLEVPLGYGYAVAGVTELAADIPEYGAKENDLVLVYHLLDKKLETEYGEPVQQEILDNLDNFNSVNLIISKDYAKDLIKVLQEYVDKA